MSYAYLIEHSDLIAFALYATGLLGLVLYPVDDEEWWHG